jgi:predicted HTH transcriptional regulator
MTDKRRIFVSSVQKELAAERRALKDFAHADPLLRRFFDVFLFEDLPASGRRADQVYLEEVDRCDVYVGLLGNDYGYEDAAGVSPTEHEFNRATAAAKERLVFVKGDGDTGRHPKMRALLRKVGEQLIRRRFTTIPDLTAALYASLVDYLDHQALIQNRPFDERICHDATLDDIDPQSVADFVRRARHERKFPLPDGTPTGDALTHLRLLDDRRPTNAALLLFGRDPQRFVSCAEVRCMHFHGTEILRPAPSYQIFKGRLFEQVDRAVDFVLSVLNVSVGTRALSTQAPVAYEIPPDVVREAIVNAIAHRDYASAAAVQVSVFADRVEVWNPGVLPPPLTPERLRMPHNSVARNARICDALFLARYIEKYGTGTLMMIRESVEHALPEPDFEQRGGEFVATVWRDWVTEKVLAASNLSERQRRAIGHVKTAGRIANRDYQELTGSPARTATRDLGDLVRKGLLRKAAETGRGTHYVLAAKPAINRPNRPSSAGAKGSQKAQSSSFSGERQARDRTPAAQQTRPTGTKLALSRHQVEILGKCRDETPLTDLLAIAGRSDRTKFRDQVLKPLLVEGLIEMTIPDKPTSRLQQYRLTPKGRDWLAGAEP